MGQRQKRGVSPSIGDHAVLERTGKSWNEWFRILDRAGASKLDHRQIVALLDEGYKLSPWWVQMVTVSYEQARGLREVHQKPSGYEIGRSKTIEAPVEKAFAAWSEPRKRRRWLQDPEFTVRKATRNKSLRITWIDGETSVHTTFWGKGADRCQVQVQHGKLRSAAAAKRMKTYWGRNLDRLKQALEP